MRIAVSIAVSAAFVAAAASAQQTPPVFRSRTDLVQLDVSVLDKKRKPIHGLTLENFEVRELGVPCEDRRGETDDTTLTLGLDLVPSPDLPANRKRVCVPRTRSVC